MRLFIFFIALFTMGCANLTSTSDEVEPDYNFPQFETMRSIAYSSSWSIAPQNDQVLLISHSPKVHYLLILERPDNAFEFNSGVGMEVKGSHLIAGMDRVFALESTTKKQITIQTIYKLVGKEQLKLARKLVREAKEAADKANESQD